MPAHEDTGYIEQLFDWDFFNEEVSYKIYTTAAELGVLCTWSKARSKDAHLNWLQDLRRLEEMEDEIGKPDHIKCASHLIYWLRRMSPISSFTIDEGCSDTDPSVEFLLKYGREYLAFNFGYEIARTYECNIKHRNLGPESFSLQSSMSDVKSNDFVICVSHVLKLKNISPHAITIILKAVFLRP